MFIVAIPEGIAYPSCVRESEKNRLLRALRETISEYQHQTLAASDIVELLDELASEVASASLTESEPFFQAVETDSAMPAAAQETGNRLRNFVFFEQRPEGARVAVEIMTLHGLLELESQLEQRGLFLDISEGPVPGQVVDVCLMMPNVDAEVWFEGRVVFQSPSGTAIDLRPPASDTASAWAEAQEAFRSATPFRRVPSGQPRTTPPRLRQRSKVRHGRAPRAPVAASFPDGAGFSHRLRTRIVRLRQQNAFDRLGLHWSAYTTRILDAYRREVAPFLPENLPADAGDLDDEIRDVISRLTEARDGLRDPDCRRALRHSLVSNDEIRYAITAYGEKGDLALMRGDLEDAVDAFRRVVELEPENNAARAKLTLLSTSH